MEQVKLFMVLVGCKPAGRHIEQHDVFFGIGTDLTSLVPDIEAFWPDSGGMHVDGFREVTWVDDMQVSVIPRGEKVSDEPQLYFINLGGYKENEMEEFHYKMLATGRTKNEALKKSKDTAFFKHTGFPGAASHIDDKYGVDVDDIALIEEILPAAVREKYALQLTPASPDAKGDNLHLGYFKMERSKSGRYLSE